MEALKNPWVIGGIGVALALVLILGKSGSSATDLSSASYAGASQVNLGLAQLSTQQDIAAIGANVANNQTAAALESTGIQSDAATTLGMLSFINGITANTNATGVQHSEITAGVVQNAANNQAQLALTQINAPLAADVAKTIAGIQANEAVTLANISSTTQLGTANIYANAANNKLIASGLGGLLSSSGGLGGIFSGLGSLFGSGSSSGSGSGSDIGSLAGEVAPLALAFA